MEQPTLHGFAFGEHLEGVHQRSLGFRLLAPGEAQPWGTEVEALARRLQAAPYPDHWPPTDLFCSVLLSDGQRVVGMVRYGLADHTPSQRRGGLELIGVVGPGSLDVPSALAVYRWLAQRRNGCKDLHGLGGQYGLGDVLQTGPPAPPPGDPVPVLPIRMWQEGALLFAATAPSDPDHRLGLLEQGPAGNWQWLPLVGADFPLQTYAQRGPLVAWTAHLAGVAVKLDRKPAEEPVTAARTRPPVLVGAAAALLALLLANLWATLSLRSRIGEMGKPIAVTTEPEHALQVNSDAPADRFAEGLQRLLHQQGSVPEWSPSQRDERYERLAANDKDLRGAGSAGKEVVVALSVLSNRGAERVEGLIRKALENKGYDPKLIDLACRTVREQLEK